MFRPTMYLSAPRLHRLGWTWASLFVLMALLLPLQFIRPTAGPPAAPVEPVLSQLPLYFIPNQGQTDPTVRFQAPAPGGMLFFTPDAVVFSLPAGEATTVARLQFEGSRPAVELTGSERQAGQVNYFLGNDPARWQTGLPTYAAVTYHQLYPGIDLRYDGLSSTAAPRYLLKGTYLIAPGADPGQIRWRYQGIEAVSVDETTGALVITLPQPAQAKIVEQAPVAWQTINGRRVTIAAAYTLRADGSLGFTLPQGYNPAYPLIIDPILSYSTFLGGAQFDYGWDIAADAGGNAYVAGYTLSSADFPTTVGPSYGGGATDVFVAKLNATGSDLVYATYLGGSASEAAFGLALDDQGNVYLTGETSSADFPTPNAVQATQGMQYDGFIAKLNATGSTLVYATYLGGNGDERSWAIGIDQNNNAYVAGYTRSFDFPTLNAPQPTPGFGQGLNEPPDAFVTSVISQSGVYTWGYSTYLGGTDWDEALALTVEPDGTAYLTGRTGSADYPLVTPAQATLAGPTGSFDAFVTSVISQSGVYTWGFSTYLGGSASDTGRDLARKSDGSLFVLGDTTSTDFPLRVPLQPTPGGGQDAFLTQVISASGVYTWGKSTYLGGNGEERGQAIALDAADDIYIAGYTRSTDLPMTGDAYDSTCGSDDNCASGGDIFLARFNGAVSELRYATYLGGQMTDIVNGMALDGAGNVYLTGDTGSADFPTTSAAYDTACNDGSVCGPSANDAFVAKFDFNPEVSLRKTANPPHGAKVGANNLIAYTIVAHTQNVSPTNVVISDTIPAGVSYVTGTLTSTLGLPTFDGSQVQLSLPGLAANTTLTLSFQVQVVTSPTLAIANKAILSSDQTGPVDSNPVFHPLLSLLDTRLTLPIIARNFQQPTPTPTPPGTPTPIPSPTPSNCAPRLVTSVAVGNSPQGLAIDETHRRVYIANQGSNSLAVINSNGDTLLTTVTGLSGPRGVAFDPGRNIIWVTNLGNGTVTPVQANSDATQFVLLAPVTVGAQPWDVAYDPVHDAVYVVNNAGNSVTVIDAATRQVTTTLSGDFDQPFHLAVNPATGKVYVANFGSNSVTVINGTTVSKVVSLFDSTQPYGIAVDEVRNLVYVATVNSHRMVVVDGVADAFLGWASFQRGFNPNRPVPLRAVAVNPNIGPAGDGGHLWSLTATGDGSERNQALLIPKGWSAYFNNPVPYDLPLHPTAEVEIDRTTNRVYFTNGLTPGTVTVLEDLPAFCLTPFAPDDEVIGVEIFTVEE